MNNSYGKNRVTWTRTLMNTLSLKKHFCTSKIYTVLGSLRLPASEVRRRITGKLPEDTFFIISCSFLLRMRIRKKNCRENQNTLFVFNNFIRKSCRLWDNVAKYGTAWQVTDEIWRMRIAYWIPKATNTHSDYVIIIIASPQQQWLHERVSMLSYKHIACLVIRVTYNF